MKAPPNNPHIAPRAPRDTLDDADTQLHTEDVLTEPIDPSREAPTDLAGGTGERTDVLGPRELPTGPAVRGNAPWMQATPWANPDALAPGERKSDPWFWPVFVFVIVLLGCIGVFFFQEMHKRP